MVWPTCPRLPVGSLCVVSFILTGHSAGVKELWHLSTEIVGASPNPTARRPLYTGNKSLLVALLDHHMKIRDWLSKDRHLANLAGVRTYKLSTAVLYEPSPSSSETEPVRSE